MNNTGLATRISKQEIRAGAGSRILGYWGVLLILFALLLGPEATFTFGAVCFGGLLLVWFKEWSSERGELFYLANGAMLVLCTVWFMANLAAGLLSLQLGGFIILGLVFLFPPLIAHLSYLETAREVGSNWRWKLFVAVHYPISVAACLTVWVLLSRGFLEGVGMAFPLSVMSLFALLFASVGTFSYFMHKKIPPRNRKQGRSQIRTNMILFTGAVAIFFSIIIAMVGGLQRIMYELSWLSRSLPLVFLFANSYYENRFAFFDVFVKRATLFYVALAGLMLYFRILPGTIDRLGVEAWMQPAAYALTLVPFVLILPWIYTKIGMVLDRFWLGRSFNTVEAVKFFLEGIQSATTPDELSMMAESRLGKIFRTQVKVQLGAPENVKLPFEVVQTVPIPAVESESGTILLGARFNQAPYFAQDLKLIEALATVYAHIAPEHPSSGEETGAGNTRTRANS